MIPILVTNHKISIQNKFTFIAVKFGVYFILNFLVRSTVNFTVTHSKSFFKLFFDFIISDCIRIG